MAWEHKGISIEISGANFVAEFDGKRIVRSSLAATKKAIDKEMEAKAEEESVALKLPVVILLERRHHSEPSEKRIVHGVITGVDRETFAATGIDPPEGMDSEMVLPDSKENTKRLEQYIRAEAAWKVAEASVQGRGVGIYWRGYGRENKRTFGECVTKLRESYNAAKKGDSDD